MLAINTAFMTANLALKTADGRVIEKEIDAKSKHSENVLKTIDEMCEELGINIIDVQTVSVVTGPGSFTGLRIGTAIAKALGCANKSLHFISVSSLELLAYIIAKNNLCKTEFVCVLNALSGLYFVGKFNKDGIKIEQEKMIDNGEYLKIKCPKFTLLGDLEDEDLKKVQISSLDLLEFSLLKEKQKEFTDVEDILPLYLRPSQAEDNLLKNAKKD